MKLINLSALPGDERMESFDTEKVFFKELLQDFVSHVCGDSLEAVDWMSGCVGRS
jgi:hypothetical protein